ncbi:regulatory protein, luxR family [Amycolatopsis xylanica]|uniref:Regulatory protein, luxR family n=1 Tax=Amycolatopsis xylanica TaxID=589385 RepID=A0A1H3PBQ5_9PSEU|nr:regulatory protein, luxR family [Amycolatopsis xylanica]
MVRLLNEDITGELSQDALARFTSLVGCDMASYAVTDHGSSAVVDAATDRPEHNLLGTPGFAEALREHPGFGAYRSGKLALGSSIALSELGDRRSLGRLALFADHWQPRGIVDQLVCVIGLDGRHGTVLTFNRSRRGFSRRDRAVVELLAPHVQQRVTTGKRLAALAMAARIAEPVDRALDRLSALTPRERDVARHLASGATDREIARVLMISHRTVHKHLEQIYRKLGLTNRTGLLALVTRA